jgi:hypothetical protein
MITNPPPKESAPTLNATHAIDSRTPPDGVLELPRAEPFPPVNTQIAQQLDVRWRAAETDAADAAPFSQDGGQGYPRWLTAAWLASARGAVGPFAADHQTSAASTLSAVMFD